MSKKHEVITNKYQTFYEDSENDHHVTFDSNDGVVVVASTVGGILFVQHDGRLTGSHSLELIRGYIENGETPVRAAIREFTEESGLQYAASNIAGISDYGDFSIDAALTNQRIHVIGIELAHTNATYRPQVAEKIAAVQWIKKDKISETLAGISDGITLAAIAKAHII